MESGTQRFWIVKQNDGWVAESAATDVDEQAWEEQIGNEQLVTFKGLNGKMWNEMSVYVLEQQDGRMLVELE